MVICKCIYICIVILELVLLLFLFNRYYYSLDIGSRREYIICIMSYDLYVIENSKTYKK